MAAEGEADGAGRGPQEYIGGSDVRGRGKLEMEGLRGELGS